MKASAMGRGQLALPFLAAALGLCSAADAQSANGQTFPGPGPTLPSAPHEENSGQDPTRPVTRIDLRLKYVDNPGGSESQLFTLRADKPFVLGGGWKLSTRADLPLVRSNSITPHNPYGHHKLGIGDVLMQALFIAPPRGKTDFAFGTQLIVPTGTDDQFTTGKW